jgi:hypothetical protein
VWEAGARHGDRLLDLFGVELRMARDGEGEITLLHNARCDRGAFVSARWVWIAEDDTEALHASLFGAAFDRELIRIAGTGANSAAKFTRS